MLKLHLRNRAAPNNKTMVLEFPLHENVLAEAAKELGVGIGPEKDCMVEGVERERGGLQALIGTCINLDEVQFLAKRLDSLDKNELTTFYAAASHEQMAEMKDLINLTYNLDCYFLVTDFSDVAAVGCRFELTRCGGMTEADQKNTDFLGIGHSLLESGKGAVTPYGVLYPTGNRPELVYNGEQFPEYHWRDWDEATLILTATGKDVDSKTEYLYFPCCEVEIDKALLRIGVSSLHDCEMELDCPSMDEATETLFIERFPLAHHIDSLNRLTRSYLGFDAQERDNFHALLQYANPQTPEAAATLGENFFDFLLVPGVTDAESYGRRMYEAMAEMQLSPEFGDFFQYASYGNYRIKQEGGSFNDYGYIAYRGESPAVKEILNRGGSQAAMERPSRYRWFVMEDPGTAEEHIHDRYTLNGAIDCYNESLSDHRCLGVRNGQGDRVTLLVLQEGGTSCLLDGYAHLPAFAGNETVLDAVERLQLSIAGLAQPEEQQFHMSF